MNARVLAGPDDDVLGHALHAYLDPLDAARARDLASVFTVVLDGANEPAGVVAALERAGAFAKKRESHVVAIGTVATFASAASHASGAAVASGILEIVRAAEAVRHLPSAFRARGRRLDPDRAAVMGIVNVTPDSFYDGGKYSGVDAARARAAELAALGAAIVDIGGRSYSASNPIATVEQELERVVPAVRAIAADGLDVMLSIDTTHASVAEAALDAGAHLINDCSGLSDPKLAGVVARADAALVVMHVKGRLNVRDASYAYVDALGEIATFLRERLDAAREAGVAGDSIAVDPGLEFGKEPATDLEILGRFRELRSLGAPIVLAASRKSFLGRVFDRPASGLLVPSLAAAALGIAGGSTIVRAHDVAETADLARLFGAVRSRLSVSAV